MTETLPPAGIDLFDVEHIHPTEVEVPLLSPEAQSAMDRVWDGAVQANTTLSDGPVVAWASADVQPAQQLLPFGDTEVLAGLGA
ncbi:hypothetical protein [Streptomyces albidochromogenes]|uniref:hypothetical protein n=1 Tax=Streptomyces albidochromogenes TaxID=329524 RepID=UPI001FCC3CC9|nr:hypothetical protein [Streptomyces albidochromogenes]